MAYDERLARLLRDDLTGERGITERTMFGGLCFLRQGNMVCGVHRGGAMFRVGKPSEDAALAIAGATPLALGGRKMGGMIEVTDTALADADKRLRWVTLALDYARSLPPK